MDDRPDGMAQRDIPARCGGLEDPGEICRQVSCTLEIQALIGDEPASF